MARAIAEAAYEHGALFVDLRVFDPLPQAARRCTPTRTRSRSCPRGTGSRCWPTASTAARSRADGPGESARDGRCLTPSCSGATRYRACARPTRCQRAHHQLDRGALPNAGLGRPCPPGSGARGRDRAAVGADRTRLPARRAGPGRRLARPRLRSWRLRPAARRPAPRLLRFVGPGTDLTVGLLAGSRWMAAAAPPSTACRTAEHPHRGGVHHPRPGAHRGHVTSTRPLEWAGRWCAACGSASPAAAPWRSTPTRAPGRCARSPRSTRRAAPGRGGAGGRQRRIGPLGTVFYDTLLDENAASHIALGAGTRSAGPADAERINQSAIHIDFMIGSSDVAVTGTTADGTEVPFLRGGSWQI